MCRLFAVLSPSPVRVHRAFAALRALSHEHPDGWGVARFDPDGATQIELSLDPAHQCARFRSLGDELETRFMLAHLRQGSVGDIRRENTHPFQLDGWTFAHNGTVQQFEQHRAALEALISEPLRAHLHGATDSERCFLIFLTRLKPNATLREVAATLAAVTQEVRVLCDDGAPKKSSMNFMLSDGKRLVLTRSGKSLFHAIDGQTHLLSSEPLWSDQVWNELPDDSAFAIDESLKLEQWAFAQL